MNILRKGNKTDKSRCIRIRILLISIVIFLLFKNRIHNCFFLRNEDCRINDCKIQKQIFVKFYKYVLIKFLNSLQIFTIITITNLITIRFYIDQIKYE